MKKQNLYIRLAAGWLCLGLGGLGVIVPLLPTTPFLLLAAICFGGASPRLYSWLVRCGWVKQYLDNYRSGCGVPPKTKTLSLVFLWSALIVSGILKENLYYRGVLLLVGIGVSIHLLCLKSGRTGEKEE